MRILILGSDNFLGPLRELGHEAWYAGREPEADLRLADPDPDWREIERLLAAKGLKMDAVLVNDNIGRRNLPTGLWSAPLVTAFYGLDSPLNRFWQTPYARLFDLVFFDQRQEAEDLAAQRAGVHWLPVGVQAERYAGQPPDGLAHGVCFVGVVNEKVRPKRSALLYKVGSWKRLETRGGRQGQWCPTEEAADLYRRYQVTLNENLFPGVTTRPLEVMASGGCLLTEAAPGSMDLYFRDGEHLLYFTPDNLKQKLEYAFEDKAARSRMAAAGREAVLQGHTLKHRAAVLADHLEQALEYGPPRPGRATGGRGLCLEGQALLMVGVRWPAEAGFRLNRAAGRLQAGMQNGSQDRDVALAAGLNRQLLGDPAGAASLLREPLQGGTPEQRLAAWLAMGEGALPPMGLMPGVAAGPGSPEFHLAAAELLVSQGRDLCPGFATVGLPMAWWHGIDHALQAAKSAPGLPAPWEMAGDILMRRNAPCEAASCYQQALEAGGASALTDKLHQARREGYLD